MSDLEPEKAVLGAIMLDPLVINDVAEHLRPGDFASRLGEIVYGEMLAMRDEGVGVDIVTLGTRLASDQEFVRFGGAPILFDLMHATPTAANVLHYVGIVSEAAHKRRAKAALTRGLQMLDEPTMQAGEVIDLAMAEMQASTRSSGRLRWMDYGLDVHLASLLEPVRHIPTPWPALNAVIGGFAPGRLYIVGARPSVGKSIVGLQAARALAKHGSCSMSSLEMSHDELRERLLADMADIPLDDIQGHCIPESARPRLWAAAEALQGMDIVVDDRSSISAADIGTHARQIQRRGTLSGVVLDYVQLMGGSSRRNRQEEVAAISRSLKLLARSLDVPVIALAQLNRGSADNKRLPGMHDLRESGALEQDADVVILLSRKIEKDPQTGEDFESPNEVVMDVDKNRHGRRDRFTLILDGAHARLLNPTFQRQMGLGGPDAA